MTTGAALDGVLSGMICRRLLPWLHVPQCRPSPVPLPVASGVPRWVSLAAGRETFDAAQASSGAALALLDQWLRTKRPAAARFGGGCVPEGPEPPHLVEAVREWPDGEVYLIAGHGIRMSRMAAFGAHHGPERVVALTASVTQMVDLWAGGDRILLRAGRASDAEAAPFAAAPPSEEK